MAPCKQHENPTHLSIITTTEEQSSASALLAANQGVYNLMIALGLVWGLLRNHKSTVEYLSFFVVAVGIYGAITVKLSILITQALPVAIALVLYRTSQESFPPALRHAVFLR